ncbi:MAG TPA: IS1595 family transposase [Candidatus Eisenbacteria bacterium]|nr:IS1595 family transposase [Candidatus Eisenbacteria bacterium]
MEAELKTLQQAIQYFSDPDNCHSFLMERRFPDGVTCPRCGSKEVRFISTRRLWECKTKHPKRQFSVKVNTIFEESPIGLDKWLMVVWMIANCKNGISSYEIHRAIGVTQKSAWFMLHRVRVALRIGTFHKLGDGPEGNNEVEADESFIGGKMRNMHKDRRARFQADKGAAKTVVLGMLDRPRREIRAKVVPNVERKTLQDQILKEVKHGSKLYTDNAVAYDRVNWWYVHDVVDHSERYVNGRVHTNGLENFWSLLKRNLRGTYVAVEPFHLDRYLDEQVFRYNNRGTKEEPMNDFARFDLALRNVVGKRLTYKELTGKEGETTPF